MWVLTVLFDEFPDMGGFRPSGRFFRSSYGLQGM